MSRLKEPLLVVIVNKDKSLSSEPGFRKSCEINV